MLRVEFTLVGLSPYSQSRVVQSKKNTGETPDAFEERTWREHCHADDDGQCFIPCTSIKNCLSDCARFLSESVPGKGKATYTKHFEAGVMVVDNFPLGVKVDKVEGERLFLAADGKRGSGKRVWKKYPKFDNWRASGSVYLLDPVLIDKPDKVREYLEHAGTFIGLGRFRPRNGGFYGRFKVEGFKVVK